MTDRLDHRYLMRLLALGRIGLGVLLTLAPRRAGAGWIGTSSRDRPTAVVIRGLGIRDVVLGTAVLRALEAGDDSAGDLIGLAAVVDVTDAAATLVAARSLPARGWLKGFTLAGCSAVLGLLARDRLGGEQR